MACTTCKNKCTCGDSALSIPANFSNDPTVCPTSAETCSEVFDMDCICYNGMDIVELDIKQGDRLSAVLHKLILANTSAACSSFGTAEHSPLNLVVSSLTATSFVLTWDAVTDATSYVLELKEASSATWLLQTAVTTNTDTAVGLTADTIYDIRVRALFASSSCYSLNFRIKTLTA